MPTRTARTAWNGTLQEGSGQVELSSSKVGTYEVSFPKRAAEDADRLSQEAMTLFRQGKRDEGFAKYQEIVDKDYASARYRNIKEQLKARK